MASRVILVKLALKSERSIPFYTGAHYFETTHTRGHAYQAKWEPLEKCMNLLHHYTEAESK
jgi:hypothetical protein